MKRLISVAMLVAAGGVWADDIPTFYRCGNVLSDRPMPACADAVMREQKLEAERTKKAADKERAAQQQLTALLARFPNPAAIERRHQEDLQQVRRTMPNYVATIARLEQERRSLLEACDCCDHGKPMPQNLRSAIDSNEALLSVQKQLAAQGPAELKRIDDVYAGVLTRMKELWKKAPIESLRAGNP